MSDLDLLLRRQSVHDFIRPILAQTPSMLRVLDLGCGSGHVWDGIPRDRVQLIGMDIVPEMVRSAANHTPGDRFLVADATRLPFDDSSLDLITCLGVLEYVPDPASALLSMSRVLRSSGQLIISFPNRTGLFRRLSRCEVSVERWVESKLKRLLRMYDCKPDIPFYKHNQWTMAESLNLLRSAGFNVLDVRFNTFGLWGRLGRLRASLFLSQWLSRQFGASQCFGSAFACTMVIRAHKATALLASHENQTFQSLC